MNKLLDILTFRREHNSEGEEAFIKKYLSNFQTFHDPNGEVIAYVYDNHYRKCKHNILWSCHIDTMHRSNPTQITQEVYCDTFNTAFVDETADCLGGDDGGGIFLLLEMIEADIEGTYIFHRGEEKGCIGSKSMALNHEDFLKQFTHAIAFDRKGTTSIITHQAYGRCASDRFSQHMADLLGMGYILDDGGIYTDTAEYTHIISECSNVSIGYQSEHSNKETLDVNHVLKLRDKMISIEWDQIDLTKEREPQEKISKWDYYYPNDIGSTSFEDLKYLDHRSLLEFVKKSDPRDLAIVIEDLISQMAYYEDAINDPYYSNDDPMDRMNEFPF
jgi:hypothetical protein